MSQVPNSKICRRRPPPFLGGRQVCERDAPFASQPPPPPSPPPPMPGAVICRRRIFCANCLGRTEYRARAERHSPGCVNCVTAPCLPLLPGFPCSIHATWGPPFSPSPAHHACALGEICTPRFGSISPLSRERGPPFLACIEFAGCIFCLGYFICLKFYVS